MAYQEVYQYWFGEGSLSDPTYVGERMKLWFGKNAKVDGEMRDKFGDWLKLPVDPAMERWKISRKGWVSLVVLHDQFPRNIHRGTPKMFAWDAFALKTAREALSQGVLENVSVFEAMFLILPFEHSENLADQEQSVQLFNDLRDRVSPEFQSFGDEILNYAIRHHEIVERFGRFPHRNETLGRTSTPEEIEFLKQPGSGF